MYGQPKRRAAQVACEQSLSECFILRSSVGEIFSLGSVGREASEVGISRAGNRRVEGVSEAVEQSGVVLVVRPTASNVQTAPCTHG